MSRRRRRPSEAQEKSLRDIEARLAGGHWRSPIVLKISANIIETNQVDIKKPTYRDRPTDKRLSFSWSWRPKSLEQLDDAIRLTTRIRDVRVVRGFVLGLGIKVFREDPERWISYSRNKNWYRWALRQRYWPVRNMYASMVSAVDQSAAADLIENVIVPPGNLGEQSRFRATCKLMALVAE